MELQIELRFGLDAEFVQGTRKLLFRGYGKMLILVMCFSFLIFTKLGGNGICALFRATQGQ